LKENVIALQQTQSELTEALGSSRQRQQILETLLANLQTGVPLVDARGKLRLINQSVRHLLNLPAGWIPGRSVQALCTGRLKVVGGFFEELHNQGGGHLQRELDIAVGRRNLHVLARGARLSAVGPAGVSGYLIVLDDVSSLAETQRHRAWAEVAQRLAHEIKNPLTPIKLAAERLQRRFRDKADDGAVFDSCTSAIIGQVERLQRLIGDFSTLARMPRPRIRPSSIRTMMREIGELYASFPGVAVEEPADEVMCPCDADQVRQVLINLMDNAISASQGHGVHLYAGMGDGMLELHVEDQGEGIAEEHQEHVFEPYFSTKAYGSGLGLAIARRIAEEHEGTLALLSFRHPTHFCLRLPFQVHSMEAT